MKIKKTIIAVNTHYGDLKLFLRNISSNIKYRLDKTRSYLCPTTPYKNFGSNMSPKVLNILTRSCFYSSLLCSGTGMWLMTELLGPLTAKEKVVTFSTSLLGSLGFNYHYCKLKNTSKENAKRELLKGKDEQAPSFDWGHTKVLKVGTNIT